MKPLYPNSYPANQDHFSYIATLGTVDLFRSNHVRDSGYYAVAWGEERITWDCEPWNPATIANIPREVRDFIQAHKNLLS